MDSIVFAYQSALKQVLLYKHLDVSHAHVALNRVACAAAAANACYRH